MHKTSNQICDEISGVYKLIKPENPLPVIFDSPHSGTVYPDDFDYACDFLELKRAEDSFVDELFADAPQYGAPLLSALFPRTYIDPNRAADDIDPEVLDGPWPDNAEPLRPTNRSQAGIGLIRRLLKPNLPLYNHKITPTEVQRRLKEYYWPYHHALKELVDDAYGNFGQSWHINCHSMPSAAFRTNKMPLSSAQDPDFVLGDRNGTSCDLSFTHTIKDFLETKSYNVAINNPYRGVELIERYSKPSTGRHSLQIEINRRLYMDEKTCIKNSNFNKLKDNLNALIDFIISYAETNITPIAAD